MTSYNPLKSWMAWVGFALGLIVLGFAFVDRFSLMFFPIQVVAFPAILILSFQIIFSLSPILFAVALFSLPIFLFFVGYGIHLSFKTSKMVGWIILGGYFAVSVIGGIISNLILSSQ